LNTLTSWGRSEHEPRVGSKAYESPSCKRPAVREQERSPIVKSKLGIPFVCVIALVTACSRRADETATIRKVIDGFVKAIRAKDIDGVMSVFAPEVVSFDISPPLQHGGGEAFVKRWQELFDSYQTPIDYELQDLSITAGDDVAFSHSLNRVSGTMKNGQKSDRWLRWTACFRKTNGKWLIVHEQVSVPVDMRSGKAVLDLTP
jgi:uncharacterized protein (TIGR02246 family)